MFPPLPPQAEKRWVNWLVAFDKNWLAPGLALLLGYNLIDNQYSYAMFPLLILHASIFAVFVATH